MLIIYWLHALKKFHTCLKAFFQNASTAKNLFKDMCIYFYVCGYCNNHLKSRKI